MLGDRLGRPLRDLRISVTDRCNFRCNYCMPKEVFDSNYKYLPHSSLLSFEEITRTASIFVAHGVQKIRLTGGEPLLRKNLELLIEQLAVLRTPDGLPLDLTLTTNGTRLAEFADDLAAAGVKRINVSLDTLDRGTFTKLARRDSLPQVLEGIAAARAAGSALMAALMLALGLLAGSGAWLLVTLVGLAATLIESLIGASFQQRWGWLSNELVNGLQTAIAALLAMAFS